MLSEPHPLCQAHVGSGCLWEALANSTRSALFPLISPQWLRSFLYAKECQSPTLARAQPTYLPSWNMAFYCDQRAKNFKHAHYPSKSGVISVAFILETSFSVLFHFLVAPVLNWTHYADCLQLAAYFHNYLTVIGNWYFYLLINTPGFIVLRFYCASQMFVSLFVSQMNAKPSNSKNIAVSLGSDSNWSNPALCIPMMQVFSFLSFIVFVYTYMHVWVHVCM